VGGGGIVLQVGNGKGYREKHKLATSSLGVDGSLHLDLRLDQMSPFKTGSIE